MEELKQISLDLSVLSEDVVEVLLLDETAEPSIFDEIAKNNTHRPKILHYLHNHPRTPETTRQFVAEKLGMSLPDKAVKEATIESPEEEAVKYRSETLLQKIQKMKMGERIHLALRGSKEIRSILLRDTSKEVMLKVLENPKITVSELELIAKQRTSSEEILRAISAKRDWVKNYSIILALITNPKTPIRISMRYISGLRKKDLLAIEKNRNLPDAVRSAVKKRMSLKRQ
ncbi:MAG: hypothetical protein V3R54_03810 [Thermodesulfovibrionia bacterium]